MRNRRKKARGRPQHHDGGGGRFLTRREVGYRVCGTRDGRVLAGVRGQLLDRTVEELRVLRGLTEPHVEDDLLEPRHGERVLVAELAHERRDDLLFVSFLQARRHVYTLSMSSPQRRHTRAARPFSRRRRPTRAGLLQRPQMGNTLERWIDASFSTIPPGL